MASVSLPPDALFSEALVPKTRKLSAKARALRARVYPLSQFTAEDQERIAAAIAEERPPERWIPVGGSSRGRPIAFLPSRAWYEWHWARGIDPDQPRRIGVSPTLRAFVIQRDGLICGLCGGDVEPDDVHIDHVHPWSLGGSDHPSNLQVAHSRCNISKGARV